jgi:hypothetical protein
VDLLSAKSARKSALCQSILFRLPFWSDPLTEAMPEKDFVRSPCDISQSGRTVRSMP